MNKYTEELKKVLKSSEQEAIKNKDEYVGSEHILLSLLKNNTSIKDILCEFNLEYKKIKELLPKGKSNKEYVFYKKELLKIIEEIIVNKTDLEEEISVPSILYGILNKKETEAYNLLKKLNIDIERLKETLKTKEVETQTLLIKEIATNINEEAQAGKLDKVIGRDDEINRIIEVLARKNKNNPILIGEAGVGKTAIVEELARRIVNKEVPKFLKNKEILNLNIANVIAGTKYRGEFEEKLSKIIKELESVDNLILFIDEIHTIVGAGGAEGAIDASNILKPALARGKIKCIGATTNREFKETIEKDKALDRRFQKVYVKEPNEEETKFILKKIKKDYEKYHDVIIPENILNLTIKLGKKYITDRNEPDKSIDILDEICASTSIKEKKNEYNITLNKINKLKNKKNDYIYKNDFENAKLLKNEINALNTKLEKIKNKNAKNKVSIDTLKKVLEHKTNSKIFELENNKYLTELNTHLKLKITNQDNIIDELTKITKEHMEKNNKVPTSIMLKGNTGTGKTYLINEYTNNLKLNLIKLNMSDYTNETSITKIIGSTAGYVGYDQKNTIFEEIKSFPLSVILLEDFEEAHINIQNLIQNILETGTLKLANNETLHFGNCLFILTSNNIEEKNKIGFINKKDIQKDNKFNHILTTNNLNEENIKTIIKKENNKLTQEQIEKIIKSSNFEIFGAKKIKQLINEINVKQIVN